MKKALLLITLTTLTACNGSFSAAYLINASWDNNQEAPLENEISCNTDEA